MPQNTVTDSSVILYIKGSDLPEASDEGTITAADARTLVLRELESHSMPPWTNMEIDMFSSEGSVLIVAYPVTRQYRCFSFSGSDELLSGISGYASPPESQLTYLDGHYLLTLSLETGEPPMSMYEFGDERILSDDFRSHIHEHGSVIIKRNAAGVLKKYFS